MSGKLASLERLGHDAVVVCQLGDQQQFVEQEGHRLFLRIPIFDFPLVKQLSLVFFPFLITLFVFIFSRIDVVYERGRIFGGVGVLLAALFRVRSVYELNEPYPDIPVLLGQYRAHSLFMTAVRGWHDFVVNHATMITVTHPSLIRQGIAPKTKTIVIEHGVDSRVFSGVSGDVVRRMYNLSRKFVVLYAGSFAPWHACDQILRAAQLVVRKSPKVVFLMVGKGDMYLQCRQLAKELCVEKAVLFVGNVPYEEMPRYVAASDACLALFDRTYPPFQAYSFFYSPMKVNEYRACGKPIIASNFGNLAKLVKHRVHGLLVHEHHTREVVDAILTLTWEPGLCEKIGKTNRADAVRRYEWDSINKRIFRTLEILSRRR